MSGQQSFEPRLESLRGLAAFMVASHHGLTAFVGGPFSGLPAVLVLPTTWLMEQMSNPGMAVLFFFVLSGYVLGQSLERDPNYVRYIVRRALRILPAFVVSILFAYACVTLIRIDPAPDDLTGFFKAPFWPMPTTQQLYDALVMRSSWVNGPTWSIHWEIVGSIALPILVYLHRSIGSKLQVPLFIVASAYISFGHSRAYILPIVQYFYAGYFLPPLIARYLPQYWITRFATFAVGYWIILDVGPTNQSAFPAIGAASLGASLMIGAVLSSPNFLSWLLWRPLRFLGRVSYSFYLFHWPVFYVTTIFAVSLSFFPHGTLGNWLICLGSIAFALGLSAITYRLIEMPLMRAGKNIAVFLSRQRDDHTISPAAPPY